MNGSGGRVSALLLLFLACMPGLAAKAPRPTRPAPNLVLIVADDLAEWAIGAYGNREVPTPNLDRLANEGVRFANAFATSPLCTPSRANILTGLETVQLGTLNDATSAAPLGYLPYGAPSWAREAQRRGFRTALIGKWHLGDEPERSPTRYGFDYFFGFRGGANLSRNPFLARSEGKHVRQQGFTDDLLVDDAVRFLEHNGRQPFVLLLALRAPHLPYRPAPEADLEAVHDVIPALPSLASDHIPGTGEPYVAYLRSQRRDYYANVHTVDRNLGRLTAALQRLKLADDTVLMVTSDNGYLLGDRGLFNKGAAAPIQYDMFPDNRQLWVINMWDRSLRVPLIVRWPGVTTPGTVWPQFVTLTDLYRSILGILQIPVPAGSPVGGMDFSALLRGRKEPWRDAVFGQYTSDRLGNTEFVRMIRTDRWKLVLYGLNPSSNALYDLQADPGELDNLYYPPVHLAVSEDGSAEWATAPDVHREIRESLERRLRDWQRSIDDPALILERQYAEHERRAFERWQGPATDRMP
jgi:choline-sulfatase